MSLLGDRDGRVLAGLTPPAWSLEFVAEQLTQIDGRVYRASLYCREDRWRIEHNNPGSIEVTIVR